MMADYLFLSTSAMFLFILLIFIDLMMSYGNTVNINYLYCISCQRNQSRVWEFLEWDHFRKLIYERRMKFTDVFWRIVFFQWNNKIVLQSNPRIFMSDRFWSMNSTLENSDFFISISAFSSFIKNPK